MKKFLVVVFFCLPACGQAAYSGHGLYSGRAAYGASVCGPGNAYGCFVSNTNVINYATPIPSWGPNTCDSTNMDTLSQCGNLTGAGMTITPSDFGNAMTRATDVNSDVVVGVSNPNTTWQTADEPSVNLWNSDDTAMLLLVNGGQQFVFLWDGAAASILTPRVSFPAGTVWSRSANNHIYSLDNTTGPGIYLQDITVTLTQGSGAKSVSNLFDLTNSQCLMNSVNGFPSDPSYTNGATFPLNKWTGALGSSPDAAIFSVALSLLGGQGSGYYMARWTVGQTGCELFNTLTGTVTRNGVLVGTVPDAAWGGAFGGKGPRFKIHDTNQPDNTVTLLSSGANNYVYGTYVDGTFYWGAGTNFSQCGIGAPNWAASPAPASAHSDGDRVLPLAGNPGGFIYQIINGVSGNSGTSAPVWDQTPGHDVTETSGTPLVWRNVGIGTSTTPYFTYFCDGHTWKGFIGQAAGKSFTYHTYADPQVPRTNLAPVISPAQAGDNHLGNTNANTTDTSWMWVTSTDVGTATNLLTGPLPSAFYMESYFVAPPYSSPGVQNCVYDAILCPSGTLGQVRRAFHCFGSGWHKSFDVQNCIAVVSQTGKYAMLATDGMGQFGSTAGQAKCNVGAPNWNKSDSTDFVVGSKMFPDPQLTPTNPGNYIYRVLNCTANGGTGTCTTGAAMPTWPQFSTVAGVGTFTENAPGTITWAAAPDVNTPINTAVQNCRADVMVVKLTR